MVRIGRVLAERGAQQVFRVGGELGPLWLMQKGIVNPDYAIASGLAHGIGTATMGDLQMEVTLEAGQAARELVLTEDEMKEVKVLGLLTIKPIIYVLNTAAGSVLPVKSEWDGKVIRIDAKIEAEIANLPEAEQAEYIKELGLNESGLDKLIKASYEILGLITFLTTGADETRAWTVKRGVKAPEAAGVIHTDFTKGFIRAEVIGYEKFIEAEGELKARELGWIRTEGKEYVIQDGDVCNFLINR